MAENDAAYPASKAQTTESVRLVVTLFGTVHAPGFADVPGMTWAWEGRNNLGGDTACPTCLPEGLPKGHTPYQFTAAETAALLAVVEEADRG